jgi:predicted molibdopterin-dependent oxidoreductase YjgC
MTGDGMTDHELLFDGRALPVVPGQTVAAVLLAAGIRSWRTTRGAGRPRGLFCGIGACFDCLVTVNGTPSVRACLTEARPGDVVDTQEGNGRAV